MQRIFADVAIIKLQAKKSPELMLRALNKWRNGRPLDINPILYVPINKTRTYTVNHTIHRPMYVSPIQRKLQLMAYQMAY